MAIISTPYAARLRLVLANGDTVQNFSRINPRIEPNQLQPLRQSLNLIRQLEHPAARGYFTVQDELTEA